jgi:hypothetical protein
MKAPLIRRAEFWMWLTFAVYALVCLVGAFR